VAHGLTLLKEEFGDSNVTLDVSSVPAKISIRGSDTAWHTLNRLIQESLLIDSRSEKVGEAICPVCRDSPGSPIKISCGHTYCTACFRHMLTSASNFPIICIDDQSTCNTPIPIPTIQHVLNNQQFNDLLRTAFTTHIDRHPQDFRYCRTADCQQIYRCDTTPNGSMVHCPACLFSVCASCHEEAHDGMTCVERKLHNDPEEQERLTDQFAHKEGFKKCPRCSIWIEKTVGCNHMECRCGIHMCWVCMGIFDAASVYAHMHSAHGGIHDEDVNQGNQLLQQVDFAEQQEALRLAAALVEQIE